MYLTINNEFAKKRHIFLSEKICRIHPNMVLDLAAKIAFVGRWTADIAVELNGIRSWQGILHIYQKCCRCFMSPKMCGSHLLLFSNKVK
jgi:hypothetical protein